MDGQQGIGGTRVEDRVDPRPQIIDKPGLTPDIDAVVDEAQGRLSELTHHAKEVGSKALHAVEDKIEVIEEKGKNFLHTPKGKATLGAGILTLATGIGLATKKIVESRKAPPTLLSRARTKLPLGKH